MAKASPPRTLTQTQTPKETNKEISVEPYTPKATAQRDCTSDRLAKTLAASTERAMRSFFKTYAAATQVNRRNNGSERTRNLGGDSVRVPPLPIPNREVKPHHADDTAKVGK